MSSFSFRLPGYEQPLSSPEAYVTGVMRNFREASQALGFAVETLKLRLAASINGADPDYQIETVDGEDAAAFSGETHDFLNEDITIRLDAEQLQDQTYTLEEVKDWLNRLNGEGPGGGPINPILSDKWLERDASDPRD